MVSSEVLVRGIDRTLVCQYAEEERPISIEIRRRSGDHGQCGADRRRAWAPTSSTSAWAVVSRSLYQRGLQPDARPARSGCRVGDDQGCQIPVTVKMRAGWDDSDRNAPLLAKMVEGAGAAAVTVHGRTAAQSYSGSADWELVARIAESLSIPVFGSGDCVEPEAVVTRWRAGVEGVLVGRGVLRNPWILAQSADLAAGRTPREVSLADRGQFLLDYISLLRLERVHEPTGSGTRRRPATTCPPTGTVRSVTIDGSSARFGPSALVPKGSITDRTSARPSTQPIRSTGWPGVDTFFRAVA